MSKTEYKKYQQSIWYKIERFFDRHNHLMEFIRTILAYSIMFTILHYHEVINEL